MDKRRHSTLPLDQQRLVCAVIRPENGCTLSEFIVLKDSTVHMVYVRAIFERRGDEDMDVQENSIQSAEGGHNYHFHS